MKKLLFLLSIVLVGCNNTTTDWDNYQLKGNVEFVKLSFYDADSKFGEIVKGDLDYLGITTIEFNESGYITSTSEYYEDGDLYSKDIYSYKNDKLDNVIKYDSKGDLSYKTIYNWDADNLQSVIHYNEDGEETFKSISEYENGNLKSYSYYRNGELVSKEIITKNNGDYVLESVSYDKDGKEIGTIINEWKNKQIVKRRFISDEENSYSIFHNEKGLAIKSENCYVTQNAIYTSEEGIYYYEYEFDDNDNWIKCIVYKGKIKEPYKLIEREIRYR